MRGVKENENVFTQMRDRGQGITFDTFGGPMLYK